jgi:hypothetical protein
MPLRIDLAASFASLFLYFIPEFLLSGGREEGPASLGLASRCFTQCRTENRLPPRIDVRGMLFLTLLLVLSEWLVIYADAFLEASHTAQNLDKGDRVLLSIALFIRRLEEL